MSMAISHAEVPSKSFSGFVHSRSLPKALQRTTCRTVKIVYINSLDLSWPFACSRTVSRPSERSCDRTNQDDRDAVGTSASSGVPQHGRSRTGTYGPPEDIGSKPVRSYSMNSMLEIHVMAYAIFMNMLGPI